MTETAHGGADELTNLIKAYAMHYEVRNKGKMRHTHNKIIALFKREKQALLAALREDERLRDEDGLNRSGLAETGFSDADYDRLQRNNTRQDIREIIDEYATAIGKGER